MCPKIGRGCQHSGNAERAQCIVAYDCRHPHPGGQGNLGNQGAHPRPPRGGRPTGNRKIDRSDGTGQDPASVMPVATGILIDKHRAMEREPTQTIEVKKSVSLEDVRGELDRIRRGGSEVVEVG